MGRGTSPAIVIAAGPGIGLAVARRFARGGLPIAVIARAGATVAAIARELARFDVAIVPLTADVADETALRTALDTAIAQLGPPEVVVYNAGMIQADTPGELATRRHLEAWAVNVVGAITAAAHVAPAMARRGGGTYLITGGMPEPDPAYTSLSLGKAGVRALAVLLDKQYAPVGVRVATVTVGGPVAPGTAFDPDDIAELYWRAHHSSRPDWRHDIAFPGSPGTRSPRDPAA
ncbi:SDR family NAD(P)-dependent oxidoreductase [Jatrophihabitans cynanchi]|jgi:NAD(P)-dependent dehydrogenase (short-subunit alcohol dehydrogenase family)|uniref:SDR family NAD(P)-dependent oxidoreductase n=1 Tax=Jatrophihabitans cynanchi TaxID=2944128 RepID=A0ABY7JZ66_9ACTN|nr:SDR family NAD(P)-dependent oxidoreductase [Jatrophihabitans sp. SB3-54]WAX57864.1 SDR family NAD(P)-dependent oxidoreductase [Jatrophihabitans sp. SB3-54]